MSGDLPADDPEAEGGVGVIVGSGRAERVNRSNRLLQVFKACVRGWHPSPLKSLSKLENLAPAFESQSCDTAPEEWEMSGVADEGATASFCSAFGCSYEKQGINPLCSGVLRGT